MHLTRQLKGPMMSIFSTIKDAIFGNKAAAATPAVAPPSATPEPTAVAAPVAVSEVDVMANLAAMGEGKQLNWRTSIVDLMKQGAGPRARLYRRSRRFGGNEHLVAQGNDARTRGQWRQGARRTD